MKAAVLHEIGKPLSIDEIATPVPGLGEALVRTKACGICATDLHIMAGWGYRPNLPFVMGHEPAGIVQEVGAGVSGFNVGDRVIPNIFYSCGSCQYCRTNRETLCTELGGVLGVLSHHGAYAEYFTIPARQLFHLPAEIRFEDGAVIADAVVCAVHALRRRAQVFPGDWVLVIGLGGVGLSVLQAARAAGAHVIAADIEPTKLAHARTMGAAAGVLSHRDDFLKPIKQLTDGRGVDFVVDCHGSEQTLTQGIEALRPNGRLIIVGYTQDHFSLAPQWMSRYELEIVGSRSGGRQDTADAIELVRSEQWRSIVSDRFPLEQINMALEFLRTGRARGRVVITFDR